MKPTFKDYLSIALALLAIFLCGYGIGFLLGERKGLKHAPPPAAHPVAPPVQSSSMANWEETTLATIQKLIELTPDQLEIVKAEIAKSSAQITAARSEASAAYHREFRDLHKRLQPHLSPEQLEKLPKASPN